MTLARVRAQAKQHEVNRKLDPTKFRHVKSKVKQNLKVQDHTHFKNLKSHYMGRYQQAPSPVASSLRASQEKQAKPKKKKVVSKVKQNLKIAKTISRASSPPAKSEASKARSMRPATTTQAQKRRALAPLDKKSRNSPNYMNQTASRLNKVTNHLLSRGSPFTSAYSSQSPASSRQRPKSGQKIKSKKKSAFHLPKKASGPPSIPDINPGKEDSKFHVDLYEYEPDEGMKKEA
mmetsp:Transcript_27734/g.42031  ORF Transcript_27734/g.42031 Transcript_27734/m.42031 type:complete len:233 (+) Transcript_27734:809-1507(+)|eukprot:CAMPEP_0170484946 /NCGR_PEP_ID=MMETSP0208-20121228/4314_1 /TAXON_ID=197538 /ORGANISM="Strombidium inclinatum, Strain S3" /LENGTH=232 /DNA_ID=CAMNT_0010758433 /DNA_START=724 /DNA_END=1422 /DNA_ORIENTATION=+